MTFPALPIRNPGARRARPEVRIERQRWNLPYLCPAVSEARRAIMGGLRKPGHMPKAFGRKR
jgi:hypothetical protein